MYKRQLFVDDHCDAIELIFTKGKNGETYNIGGDFEISNIDLAYTIIKIFDKKKSYPVGFSNKQIEFVNDRPGHDFRYSIDFSKIKNSLGWKPKTNFEEGILKTINYYLKKHGINNQFYDIENINNSCLLYTSPSPRDRG